MKKLEETDFRALKCLYLSTQWQEFIGVVPDSLHDGHDQVNEPGDHENDADDDGQNNEKLGALRILARPVVVVDAIGLARLHRRDDCDDSQDEAAQCAADRKEQIVFGLVRVGFGLRLSVFV